MSRCTRTHVVSHAYIPTRAAHDFADLVSPECTTGSIPYVARWYIEAYLLLVVMATLYLVARCGYLTKKRVLITISWLVQLGFLFGRSGSSTTLDVRNYYPSDSASRIPSLGMTAAMTIFACTEPSDAGLEPGTSYLIASPEIVW